MRIKGGERGGRGIVAAAEAQRQAAGGRGDKRRATHALKVTVR